MDKARRKNRIVTFSDWEKTTISTPLDYIDHMYSLHDSEFYVVVIGTYEYTIDEPEFEWLTKEWEMYMNPTVDNDLTDEYKRAAGSNNEY